MTETTTENAIAKPAKADRIGLADILVIACFALSGLAALIYQTAWMRLFSITFGTSELAIATVLAAYMGGLALGSIAAGRFADRLRRPVLVYAVLEGGVAIAALLVPFLLDLASALLAQWLGGQAGPPAAGGWQQTLFYLVATFVIVGIPTVLMGATLPILAHHLVRADREIAPRIGLLYGINTAGAVAGVMIASFLLLPRMGLGGVVWVAVVINGLIFVLAALLARGGSLVTVADTSVARIERESRQPWRWLQQPTWILPVMLVSGSISFVYEVLWTRLLGHILGSSIYAFATMLSAFLAGIALGGGLGGWLCRFFSRPGWLMLWLQLGIAVASALTYLLLDGWIADAASGLNRIAVAMLVLFPSALFIGATYPVAVRVITTDYHRIGAASAKVYAWNTIGAIAGALFAGFILLPGFGFTGAIRFAVLTNLLLALVVVVLVLPVRRAAVFATAALCAIALLVYHPPRPDNVIEKAAFPVTTLATAEEIYYAVGKSSTVYLTRNINFFDLRTNGLPEAQVFYRGTITSKNSQRWLSILPVLARPDAGSMLIIGLGGGAAAEGVPPTVGDVDIVELEARVLEANRIMGPLRNNDPLSQPRMTIAINDARNALNLTEKKYDVIVSQPSHPWTAGASHLFTREFVQLLKAHLNEDGVLLMWMNTEFIDEPLLRSLMATIQAEFANVRVYETATNVLNFVASDGALAIEQQLAATGRPIVDAPDHYNENGFISIIDLLAMLLLDEQGARQFSAGAPLATDDRNLMATSSRSNADGLQSSDVSQLFADVDPLLNPQSWLRRQLSQSDLELLARKMLQSGQQMRVALLEQTVASMALPALRASLASQDPANYRRVIQSALQRAPGNTNLAYLAVESILLSPGGQSEVDALKPLLDEWGRLVVEASLEMRAGNAQQLAQLDSRLSQVPTSHLAYGLACELRAAWRTMLREPDEATLREALRLINIALVAQPSFARHQARAELAWRLRLPYEFRESAFRVGFETFQVISRHNAGTGPMTPEQIDRLKFMMETLRQRLLEPDMDIGDHRATVIYDELGNMLNALNRIPS